LVKNLALVTAIALLAALPLPMWNATRNLITRPSVPVPVWIAVGIAYVFSAILPVFYFAMWRNPGEIGVSKRARVFCLVGVLCGVIVMRDQMPPTTVTTALSLLATLCCVVLLIAMYLQPGSIGQKSALLRSMTRIVMVCGVLWFGVNVLALFTNPDTGGAVGTLFEQVCLFTAPFLVAVTGGFR
jgi:glucose uptake protein GlcU